VYSDPAPPTCSECGEHLTSVESGGWCVLCTKLFCVRHLVIRRGVSNCAACEEHRHTREQAGGISEADEARVVRLVLQDLARTVGPGYEATVEEAAARFRLFSDDPADFEQRVVDDVQQYLHDTFVDTTWPACPDHLNHPLWYSEQWWRCEQAGKRVALLGELFAEDKNPAG
jgi:hypothetical protein